MQVLRANLRELSVRREITPDAWTGLGGRGLIARILLDEVNPECEPLGRENKLIFAPGLLVGHMLSSCDRISIGGKSPLTRGVKEANAGGSTGMQLARLGIKVMIIEDSPRDDSWRILYLSPSQARFDPADDLVGLGVYESARRLAGRYGDKVAMSLIGVGGERCLLAAGIQNLDKDRVPSRIAARGGLGAVLGSKHLKAVIIDAQDGEKPPIFDPEAFKSAQKEFNQALMAHPQTHIYRDFGTAAMPGMSNGFGGLPTRNFSRGRFEEVDKISGEMMRELLLARGGDSQTTHACMAGCTIRCSNIFAGEDGKKIVSPLEYETIGLLGPNLEVSDLDLIARMCWEINDLGLDSIEIGAALGVAAEAGLFKFGDGAQALRMIQDIRSAPSEGMLLGHGAVKTGHALGVIHVPAVKGQAMSAYEPRAIKGTGVTYATSPQGADHTAGLTIRAKVDHLDPSIQVELSRKAQINMAGYDSLGACVFAGNGFAAAPETIRDLLNARYNWQVTSEILQELGKETLRLEREFNRRAGFTSRDDRLPEWMKHEPLPPNNSVFDVTDDALDTIFE